MKFIVKYKSFSSHKLKNSRIIAFDNSVTEVFFKYLKQREINRRTYHSVKEVQL
ncbi:hypothetical protein GTP07_05800 [Lactococcus lactis]|nr:hypothetical protein [Lactococcus lactis]